MISTKNIKSTLKLEEEEAVKSLKSTSSAPRAVGPPHIESVELLFPSKYQPQYRLGVEGNIDVMVTLSEPVIVTGKPMLRIQLYPGVIRNAKYESGSRSHKLIFRYTVEENDNSSGISVPGGDISLSGGSTIKSLTNKDLQLRHPAAVPPAPSLQVTDEFNEKKVLRVIRSLSSRTTDLANLVVEGSEDCEIYGWMEGIVGSHPLYQIYPRPAGGRENLLEIYNRRDEFPSRIPVAFMADLDSQVLEDQAKMTTEYADIIWTTGYSIENDLCTDGNPISLIESKDIIKYNAALQSAICDFVVDEAASWGHRASSKSSFEEIEKKYHADISTNSSLKLRGKSLYEVILKFYTPKRRRFNDENLCLSEDIIDTVRDRNHYPLITRLISGIHNEIDKQTKKLPSHRSSKLIKRHTHPK